MLSLVAAVSCGVDRVEGVSVCCLLLAVVWTEWRVY